MESEWIKLKFSPATQSGCSIIEIYKDGEFCHYIPPIGESPYTQNELNLIQEQMLDQYTTGETPWTLQIKSIEEYSIPREYYIEIPGDEVGTHEIQVKVTSIESYKCFEREVTPHGSINFNGKSITQGYWDSNNDWKRKKIPSLRYKEYPKSVKINLDEIEIDNINYNQLSDKANYYTKIYKELHENLLSKNVITFKYHMPFSYDYHFISI